MDSLRQKLESQGLKNVIYMVINHQGAQAQQLHIMLAERLSKNITLYKQEEQQPDVWQTLGGEKDDFFIYDRCGRLTHHISLPYSIIGHGHIEGAIRDTYCKRICGICSHESPDTPDECKMKAEETPDTAWTPVGEEDTGGGHGHGHGQGRAHGQGHGHGQGQGQGQGHGHSHSHGHGHGHEHGHHHGHHNGHSSHGDTQSLRPHGFVHGHDHGMQGQGKDGQMSQGQQVDLGQMHMMSQEANGAPVRP